MPRINSNSSSTNININIVMRGSLKLRNICDCDKETSHNILGTPGARLPCPCDICCSGAVSQYVAAVGGMYMQI